MRLKIGDFIADDTTDTLARDGETVKIERRAMAVLFLLAQNPGAVRSKDEIIREVWGDIAISDHSVAIVISQLRRAFGDDKSDPQYLKTILKRGYALVARVAPADDSAPAPSPIEFRDERPRSFRKIAAALVVAATAAGVAAYAVERNARPPVIFIADIANESGDPSNDAVAFASADIAAARIATSKRATVRRWRGEIGDVQEQGAIVAGGRIFDDGGRDVLSIKVLNADDDTVIAGRTISLEASGVVEAGAALADEVAAAAGLRLSAAPVASAFPEAAIADYWRARFLTSRRDHDSLRAARDLLVDLIAAHPDYAAAHAALADIYAHKTGETLNLPRTDTFEEAQRHLAAAERLGGETSETAVTTALLRFYRDRDMKAANAAIDRAVDLDPQNALAWQTRAMILSASGRDEKALAAIARAERIDPASESVLWDKVWFLYCAGRFEDALTAAARAQQVSPPNHLYLALINSALGRRSDAFAAWSRRAAERGLAAVPKGDGRPEDYRALITATAAAGGYEDYAPPSAILRLQAGDRDGAIALLSAVGAPRESWMMLWADRLPDLRPLKDDPRVAPLFGGLAALPGEKAVLKEN